MGVQKRRITAGRVFPVATLATVLLSGALSPQAGGADLFPSRPIRIIVSSAPGSGPDVIARLFAPALTAALGQSIVVDNRTGAGGNIGGELAAHAAADGYTLLMATANHAIGMSLYSKLNYDLLRDFSAISQLAATPYLLVVHPGSSAKSVTELIAAAKQRPGAVNYGSGGSGSPPHLATEVFSSMSGIRLTHVPYKGVTPALADLMAGRLELVFSAVPAALPLVKSGKLRALGISSAQRSALAPEVPVIRDAVPGYEVLGWYGLIAPARTPAPVVSRLHAAAVQGLQSDELRQRLLASGAEPLGTAPAQFAGVLRAEVARWQQAVRDSGARAE
jgi:tripartite-type tricarboxylate transporter receptor subunit TctC